MNKSKLIVFEDKNIRRTWFNDEWWYSVIDIIEILTNSKRPRKYWSDLKKNLKEEGFELSEKIGHLKLIANDGKERYTDCINTKNSLRLIQSIPSLKAEPFKQWLAQLGQDRLDEIENPELAQDRVKSYYELKGYPKDWIDKRLRGIAIRQELTDEWKNHGIENKKDYAILTNEIHKATFNIDIKDHKTLKNIPDKPNNNLRDHLSDLELIFNMLGEKVTTEITQNKKSQSFEDCKTSAIEGGKVAGNARVDAEKKIGKKIVSKQNYLEKQR